MKLEFSGQIFEKKKTQEVDSKSVQWEPSCSMITDRHTDMTKLIVAFRNCASAPKKAKYTVSDGAILVGRNLL